MGLLRGMARTAAVAGTATAVSNRVSRRQSNRWAAKDEQAYAAQQPVEAAPEPQENSDVAQIRRFADLREPRVVS